jgi:hypothetical protein
MLRKESIWLVSNLSFGVNETGVTLPIIRHSRVADMRPRLEEVKYYNVVVQRLKEHSQGGKAETTKCTDIAAGFTSSLDLRSSNSFATKLVWKFDHLLADMRHTAVLVALSFAYLVTADDLGTAECRCVRPLLVLLRDASPLTQATRLLRTHAGLRNKTGICSIRL